MSNLRLLWTKRFPLASLLEDVSRRPKRPSLLELAALASASLRPSSATDDRCLNSPRSPPCDVAERVVQQRVPCGSLLSIFPISTFITVLVLLLASSLRLGRGSLSFSTLGWDCIVCIGLLLLVQGFDGCFQQGQVVEPHLLDRGSLYLLELGPLLLSHALELFLSLLRERRDLHDQEVLKARPGRSGISEFLELELGQVLDNIGFLSVVDLQPLLDDHQDEPCAVVQEIPF
mmetsp:Transcript_89770/g.187565  ORF Transcript_89770/g.187565 Transcript_89770/m.187565 type:complete len:232 (-) Transcript_89770:3273-3968(-)